ncbi:hypothetical protein BMF35_a0877 [Aurantiacibacter gangjinensis]|nr:hypothetical protein BMF35_a0877 [Aurantiacibacter gangjinensis]
MVSGHRSAKAPRTGVPMMNRILTGLPASVPTGIVDESGLERRRACQRRSIGRKRPQAALHRSTGVAGSAIMSPGGCWFIPACTFSSP